MLPYLRIVKLIVVLFHLDAGKVQLKTHRAVQGAAVHLLSPYIFEYKVPVHISFTSSFTSIGQDHT